MIKDNDRKNHEFRDGEILTIMLNHEMFTGVLKGLPRQIKAIAALAEDYESLESLYKALKHEEDQNALVED